MRLLVLSAGLILAITAAATAQDIGGTYDVTGTNLDGSQYTGTAEISGLSETTCAIEWTTGETTSSGICMRDGIAFAAAHFQGDNLGLLIYEILEDGSMIGYWTVAGQDGAGTETLTPQ